MNDNRFNEFDEFDEFDEFTEEKKPVKKQKSKKEKVGFYVAFAICLVAVGLAVFSTYTGITNYLVSDTQNSSQASEDITMPVNNAVTGVVEDETNEQQSEETQAEANAETNPRTITLTEIPSTVASTDPPVTESTEDALQTMLSVSDSLSPPLKNFVIQKEYSESAVYNKTLNDWRAHAAIDLKANTGDEVYSMVDGVVDNIQSNDFLGNVISIKTDDYVVNYCGMSKDIKVEKCQEVKRGDVIGTVGVVPFEGLDATHLHLEIKVKGKYIDPLSVIKNNE
ncbi:MAG: M23 family metallopeptidase [Ruminococcus sp.]|nr:M23 family metallopeptidase [Ruminococcus sp.]